MQEFALILSARQQQISDLRRQPEFAAFHDVAVAIEDAPLTFQADEAGVTLGNAAFSHPTVTSLTLRHALETATLRRTGLPPGRAWLAAARSAAQFITTHLEDTQANPAALPPWVTTMAGDIAPTAAYLASLFPNASPAGITAVRRHWAYLGTAETIMETGGDIRLQRDPQTALNGYGCSHRPRPWAITFASSTASSSSERGYTAADTARLAATTSMLTNNRRTAIADSLQAVRQGIAQTYSLPPGTEIVLAASGTDTELLALALTQLGNPHTKIKNILIAPAETGRGVPMAARGAHFAINTALGTDVTFEAPIAGFRPDTEIKNIALRHNGGGLRPIADVETEIATEIATGIEAGKQILLHGLDLSKTGLLAPRPSFLTTLRTKFGQNFDLVIDACQTRLSPTAIHSYLALNATILITGSKFFTGPPFAGAALIPPPTATRLQTSQLPEGLAAYFNRDEFPPHCPAANNLPPSGNYGLALRWHAALGEMQALSNVPPHTRHKILAAFSRTVTKKIAENPALRLLQRPNLKRFPTDETWERQHSIFSFSIQAPHQPTRNLTPTEARALYLWLNTDLSTLIPTNPTTAQQICHIGQPVALPQPGSNEPQGILRVSAGARLISGEPSHQNLPENERIRRELADLGTVFDKIGLILNHWNILRDANPTPRYRPTANHHLTTKPIFTRIDV